MQNVRPIVIVDYHPDGPTNHGSCAPHQRSIRRPRTKNRSHRLYSGPRPRRQKRNRHADNRPGFHARTAGRLRAPVILASNSTRTTALPPQRAPIRTGEANVSPHTRCPAFEYSCSRAGSGNGRYALLFRDYLRAQPLATAAYAQAKVASSQHGPTDWDLYYDVKDPICDIIMAGAEDWAATTGGASNITGSS